jgi:hemerythrin-like domain-containing protein
MLPIGPLMIEHRLIERMIRLLAQEATRIRENISVSPEFAFVDAKFINAAVDFIRTYADEIHHGKEEHILFAALGKKPLSSEDRKIMEELVNEHQQGRRTTASLVAATEKYVSGKEEAIPEVLEHMTFLVEFYPRHIDKEDKHFFLPVMKYFSQEEKDTLLAQMNNFDQNFIHTKYQKIVVDWEASGCKCHL